MRGTISSRNMAHSARTLRIIGASLLALLMVGGSYLFSGPTPWGRVAEAQSAEELLRAYAAKDSDTDGLPDWQESLYGTDPNNPESFQSGIKDGEAVAQGLVQPRVAVRPEGESTDPSSIPGTAAAPASLTDRFAQTLLQQYLASRGENPPTQEEIVAFVKSGVADLATQSASADRYGNGDVVSSSGTLVAYVAQLESAFARNTVQTSKNELSYFSDAVDGDNGALAKISDVSDAYDNIARAVIATPVPPEARQAHLSIANALVHMSEISDDMAAMKSDPVRALMGIALYEQYARGLVGAFANLNGVLSARSVSVPEGSAGYYIVKTARDAAEAQ